MSVQASRVADMEQEMERFTRSLAYNQANLQKILTNSLDQATILAHSHTTNITGAREKAAELELRIKEMKSAMGSLHGDKDRAEKELQMMKQELEQLGVSVQDKIREREGLKMRLAEVEERVVSREQRLRQMEQKNQELRSQGERGLAMYRTHLGLIITRTSRSTLVFSFTQVSRFDPEKAFLLELTLVGDQYCLVTSEPPLPNMQQIEDRLNATNNLSGCIAYVRKAFQNMAK